MSAVKQATAIGFFRLFNKSDNLVVIQLRNENTGVAIEVEAPGLRSQDPNATQTNGSHCIDLRITGVDPDGDLGTGQRFRFGVTNLALSTTHYDNEKLWEMDANSDQMVTYTYDAGAFTYNGLSKFSPTDVVVNTTLNNIYCTCG